jgi:hypothetical protein
MIFSPHLVSSLLGSTLHFFAIPLLGFSHLGNAFPLPFKASLGISPSSRFRSRPGYSCSMLNNASPFRFCAFHCLAALFPRFAWQCSAFPLPIRTALGSARSPHRFANLFHIIAGRFCSPRFHRPSRSVLGISRAIHGLTFRVPCFSSLRAAIPIP